MNGDPLGQREAMGWAPYRYEKGGSETKHCSVIPIDLIALYKIRL